jgi:hypothetical protein
LQLRGVIPFIVALTQGSSIGGQGGTQLASSLPSLLGIAGLDLLSAFFLILYTARFVDVPSRSQPAEQLPAAEFTDVDEEE